MPVMEIAKGIRMKKTALIIGKTLIISDIHLGVEESYADSGIMLPKFHFADAEKALEEIFEGEKIGKVIINGDLKHEFGRISRTEWRYATRLIDILRKRCDDILIIRGNHDAVLEPIAEKKGLKIKDFEQIGKNLIVHGDSIEVIKKAKGISTIIIGHEHPAVSLRQGPRVEKFKCFLKGKWKRHALIAMPSFSQMTEGSDILKEDLLSPFLRQNLSNFHIYIVGDTIYDFGKVKNL